MEYQVIVQVEEIGENGDHIKTVVPKHCPAVFNTLEEAETYCDDLMVDTATTKVYEFDELSCEAQEAAVQGLADINVGHEWWESTYEDAATIGLKIEEFDIDQGSFCRGKWDQDAEDVARLIQENHGESCETHRDATTFLADLEKAQVVHKAQPGYDAEYDEDFEDTDEYEELCQEFLATICEDYRIMLQKEHEYQSSEEQIIEAIRANEYEFTADGERH